MFNLQTTKIQVFRRKGVHFQSIYSLQTLILHFNSGVDIVPIKIFARVVYLVMCSLANPQLIAINLLCPNLMD